MPKDILPTTSLPPPLKSDSFFSVFSPTRPASDRLLDLIARQTLFADLNAEQLKVIRTLAMEVHYDPDEMIFREGDPANRFFIILKGYVSLEVRCSEGTIPIRTLGPGDDLGWAWLFPPYFMHFGADHWTGMCTLLLRNPAPRSLRGRSRVGLRFDEASCGDPGPESQCDEKTRFMNNTGGL